MIDYEELAEAMGDLDEDTSSASVPLRKDCGRSVKE